MDFSIELAKSLIDCGEEFPIDFDLAWQWIGYTRKDSAKEKLIRNFEKDLDYSAIWRSVAHSNGSTASRTEQIFLTIDTFKAFGMMAGTSKGKEVRKYFLKCEKIEKQAIALQTQTAVPELPIVMPTQIELDYMRSRAWERAEMMGRPVSQEAIKRKTGYGRAADAVIRFREQLQQRAIESKEE